jgi:hypothetical protein
MNIFTDCADPYSLMSIVEVRLEMTWLATSNLSRRNDHGVICLARHPEFYIIFLVPVAGSCFYFQRCMGKEASWLWL